MRYRSYLLLCFMAAVIFVTGCDSTSEKVAHINSFEGAVSARAESDSAFIPAIAQMPLHSGGAIRTDADGKALLELVDGSARISVESDSYYEVRSGSTIGSHQSGRAVFDVNKQEKDIIIETPHGNTAVLGTRFAQVISENSLQIFVEKGLVEFTSNRGEKQKIAAGKKLSWNPEEKLPDPSEINLLESESFFGNSGSRFDFNRR